MTTAALADRTQPQLTQAAIPDRRRITEQDADFMRLRTVTRGRLLASLRRYVRELRAAGPHDTEAIHTAQSAFIQRQTILLAAAYLAAHANGARDYWQAVSLRRAPQRLLQVDAEKQHRRMRFSAPSVSKMAYEAQAALQREQMTTHTRQLADAPDSLDEWLDGLDPRVQLQADLTWTGMQDGYYNGSIYDAANPYYWVEWQLEPLAQHCDDCLSYAAGSPYGPPGSGDNELDASPGDGSTACGAACKCSLGYAPNDTAVVYGTGTLPPDTPATPEQLTVPPPAPNADLTDGQKASLDAVRDAFDMWDAARGGLPDLPDLFGIGETQGEETPFLGPLIASWDQLTPAQQQAVERLIEAIQLWKAATVDASAIDEEGGVGE